MKLLALAAMLLSLTVPIAPANEPALDSFRYSREAVYPAASPQTPSPNACVPLDAHVFAHTETGLPDLRVFDSAGRSELPYAVTLSSTPAASDSARIVQITPTGARQLTVELEMPHRPYSQVDLSLNARDYVASAHIEGLASLTDPHPVFLGDLSLYDLSSRHLGSSTALPIAESSFAYLRLRLHFEPAPSSFGPAIAPSVLTSALIPPARQAQTLYTVIAQTSTIAQRGQRSVAAFSVPAHVPIERVSFDLDPAERSNFSRTVTVSASAGQSAPVETLTGQISRVNLGVGDVRIQEQSLAIPAILGSNAKFSAGVRVAIENGQQPPLKIRGVRLEMRQRQLCFPAAGTSATLAYGSPPGSSPSQPPAYGFARTFNAAIAARPATLLDERVNPLFTGSAPAKSRLKQAPALVFLCILSVLSLLAVIAYRALHRGHHNSLRR
jgi:hypothetical protein